MQGSALAVKFLSARQSAKCDPGNSNLGVNAPYPFISNSLEAIAACSFFCTAVHPKRRDLALRTLARCRGQLGLSQSTACGSQARHWSCRG